MEAKDAKRIQVQKQLEKIIREKKKKVPMNKELDRKSSVDDYSNSSSEISSSLSSSSTTTPTKAKDMLEIAPDSPDSFISEE